MKYNENEIWSKITSLVRKDFLMMYNDKYSKTQVKSHKKWN